MGFPDGLGRGLRRIGTDGSENSLRWSSYGLEALGYTAHRSTIGQRHWWPQLTVGTTPSARDGLLVQKGLAAHHQMRPQPTQERLSAGRSFLSSSPMGNERELTPRVVQFSLHARIESV